MQKAKILIILIALVWAGTACQNGSKSEQRISLPEGNHMVEVKEVIQANSYTYLRVEELGKEYWMAINKDEYEPGEKLYYVNEMEMHNFESKDLDRVFETIFFVQDIDRQPIETGMPTVMGSTEPLKPTLEKIEVSIEHPEGAVQIGEIWTNREQYKDQVVTVIGKVTKVNASIMGRNWIHIQDGTGDENNYDLTVTSNDLPQVGDIVTFKGKIALNNDFGAGYTYEVMMEEATMVQE